MFSGERLSKGPIPEHKEVRLPSGIILMFPGQGGLQALAEDVHGESIIQDTLEEADDVLKRSGSLSLTNLCLRGSPKELNLPENAQEALLAESVALWRLFKSRNSDILKNIHASAGHSAGQYAALVAADVLKFADALRLIQARSVLTQEASKMHEGVMAAIFSKDPSIIARVKEFCAERGVNIGLFNSPLQIVISDEVKKVTELVAGISNQFAGNFKARNLDMKGAFHSKLMEPVQPAFARLLNTVHMSMPKFPVILGTTGKATNTPSQMGEDLLNSFTMPILWDEGVKNNAHSAFIEIGPKPLLATFVGQTIPEARVHTAYNMSTIDARSFVADKVA